MYSYILKWGSLKRNWGHQKVWCIHFFLYPCSFCVVPLYFLPLAHLDLTLVLSPFGSSRYLSEEPNDLITNAARPELLFWFSSSFLGNSRVPNKHFVVIPKTKQVWRLEFFFLLVSSHLSFYSHCRIFLVGSWGGQVLPRHKRLIALCQCDLSGKKRQEEICSFAEWEVKKK